jgi:hypothetical protein
MNAAVRPCGACGISDRYPSGPCRPCTKRRNRENAGYFVARNARVRKGQIDAARQRHSLVGAIYGLTDPTSGELRYVGQTRQSLRRRLSGHLRGPKGPHASLPVNRWIAKLQAASQEPQIVALQAGVHLADLDKAERSQIAEARAAGDRLLNLCPGGSASLGTWSLPLEAIRRSAEAKRGKPRSPETREKLAAANRGKKAAPETCAKRSAIFKGRRQSPEWIAKRVAAVARTKAQKPRSTSCPSGHPWNAENTYEGKRGRSCRACARDKAASDRRMGKRRRLRRGAYRRAPSAVADGVR